MIGPFQDESALLVPVPEAEPVVAEWRDRLDPSGATGVPAHITVLYPFLPPAAIDEGSRAIVGQLASAFSEFDYELAQAGWFGRKVLWLAPAPAEPFVRLIEAAMERFPQVQRYGRTDLEVIPHLTVADGGPPDAMAAAEAAVKPKLPIRSRARELWLIEQRSGGRWAHRESFPFRA
jgi:2'-5' RNA ligase